MIAMFTALTGGEFVLIDAGVGRETEIIFENLVSDGIQLGQVQHLFLTHGHLDHSGGAAYLRETLKLQVGASQETARAVEQGDERSISLDKAKAAGGYAADFQLRACPIGQLLCDGQRLSLGTCELEVIATPGHSHDLLSFCLRTEHAGDLV